LVVEFERCDFTERIGVNGIFSGLQLILT
jgi:hypothetical protein